MAGGWGTSGSRALPASAKVQAELDTVVGQARTPSLEDPERLPYTNAMLHKIQHFINMLPHALTQDTHLRSHFLPMVPTGPRDSAQGLGSTFNQDQQK